jgi:8-oxo-dGTP pyrophosphatase MutT (NUDIX family)
MEKRRLAPPVDPNTAEVVRQEEVVAILIKSRQRRGFKTVDVYLCQRDENSGCYNFIGGKRRRQESHRETAERKLFEELGLPVGTYKVEPLTMMTLAPPLETRKISNETGVYTKYTFFLYHAMHITGQADRQNKNKNRWFTEQELLAGRGRRKERIMTHEEVLGALRGRINEERYPDGLADVDISIGSASRLRATPRRDPIEWIIDNRDLAAALAALASLIYTLLKIFGVI